MAEPALYQHCEAVYRQMEREATLRVVDDDDEILVYEGYLTKLVTALRLPNPYYTFITNALQTMGCIQQLRRGGGSTPSQWWLRFAPTSELYTATKGDTNYAKRTDRYAALEQQIRDLNRRVQDLEAAGDIVG